MITDGRDDKTTALGSGGRHGSNLLDPLAIDVGGGEDKDTGPIIFAAMPFAASFEDVYYIGIRAAARALGGRAVRVDHLMHGGDAVRQTEAQLRRCKAVVADVSTNEADVLYELGYARALGKPCVQICSTPYEDLPFMIRNTETLLYAPGRTHLLGRQLATYLRALLELS